ncbi:MAG: hypothetical protein JNK85_11630, partial [Verrucomicrobiales bacterium]|nr:hypothetical protein [Verrucomicrobiales bacterium]
KAWNAVKSAGSKAIQYVKDKASALAKRFKGVIDFAKTAGEYAGKAVLVGYGFMTGTLQIWAACKALNCAVPALMQSTKSKDAEVYTDTATDLIPLVSSVKDACGCMTGDNMITGAREELGQRVSRCVFAVIDIVGLVAGFFSGGTATAGEQAAKIGLRAWLKRLLRIGGRELAEKAEKEVFRQLARKGERELAETLARMGERELRELAEQASRAGERELAEKIERELAKRTERELAEKGLAAQHSRPDGGEIKVTTGGKFWVCSSPCLEFRKKYGYILEKHGDLDQKLRAIEQLADPRKQARQLAELAGEIEKRVPLPNPKSCSYRHGESDGGPGIWGEPTTPRTDRGADFQAGVTGAPPGTEYKVPLPSRASGYVDFDGYDPVRRVLLDSKDFKKWPPAEPRFLRDKAIADILTEARSQVAAARGVAIEWHVSTQAKAQELRTILQQAGIRGITVVP